MNFRIKTKRLGKIWYLDVDHLDPLDIVFNDKLCKVFTLYDKYNTGELLINLTESYSLVYDNTVLINDDDLLKYFTTALAANADIQHQWC